ncbi:hypothetical protein IWW51_001117, partial [Coemansia sp. RSA 2702]
MHWASALKPMFVQNAAQKLSPPQIGGGVGSPAGCCVAGTRGGCAGEGALCGAYPL